MALDDTARPIAAIIADMRLLLAELEAAPVLASLTIPSGLLRVGTLATLAIEGATNGSTITGIPPDGMTLVSDDRIIIGRPTTAGDFSIILTETLDGARESPRRSTINVTIAAKPIAPTPTRVTLGNSKIRLGNRTVRLNGLIPFDDKPRLTLTGPASITEGNPSNDKPTLSLTGPASIVEGDPSTDKPALNFTGPASITEGN